MTISVIIPTYNEVGVIVDCLNSLSQQTVSDFEVIVVDDGSVDNSKVKIQNAKLQFKSQNFVYLQQNHKGAGTARNLGAKYAKGKILVFVDADMTFDKDFLKDLVKPIEEGKTKGTFSRDEIVSNWENKWARCWNVNEGWEEKKRHPKNYPDHQPVFRAILKSEFDRVGGFTPGGYDDDWSLSKKLGYQAESCELFFSPKALFYHKNPSTLPEIFNQAKWVGKRHYKLGTFGYLIALIRSSLPFSLIVGLYKSLAIFNLQFAIFKIVYDFGIFIGVLEFLFSGKSSK